MAKPSGWNADVLKGVEACERVINGVASATTSAAPVSTTDTDINWIILQNLGTANVYVGASTVANSGASRGILMRPQGETPILKVTSLTSLYLVSASGTQDVAYLAGVKT
jgi:hypothetical protein